MKTAIEQLIDYFNEKKTYNSNWCIHDLLAQLYIAKEKEKINIDNKVIHFAEWLTNKHTSNLITLYEHFEEKFYNNEEPF